jgi:hypothetical protein
VILAELLYSWPDRQQIWTGTLIALRKNRMALINAPLIRGKDRLHSNIDKEEI